MRRIWLVGIFGLAASVSPHAFAQAHDDAAPPPTSSTPKVSFWDTVLRPHAAKIALLLDQAQRLRDRADQYTEPHEALQRRQVLGDALSRFEQAARLDPQDGVAIRGVATTAFAAGDYAKAEGALVTAEALTPDASDLLQMLATTYTMLRRWDEAVSVCQRGLGSDLPPADHEALLRLLGYAYMGEGRLEDSSDAYERAVQLQASNGADVVALAGLALAYDRDEQLVRAAEVLEQVRMIDPSFAFLLEPSSDQPQVVFSPPGDRHYWRGLAYEAQQRLPEAIASFRAYLGSMEPAYRRRAGEHVRADTERLTHKPKRAP